MLEEFKNRAILKLNKKYAKYGVVLRKNSLGKFMVEGNNVVRALKITEWSPLLGQQRSVYDKFVGDEVNIVGYGGARGSGKSEIGVNGNLELMYKLGKNYNGIYLRNKAAELVEIMGRFKAALMRDKVKFSFNSMWRILTIENGAIIRFFYVENSGLESLQGGNISHITYEEPQYFKNLASVVAKVNAMWRTPYNICLKQLFLFNPMGPSTKFLKEYLVDLENLGIVEENGIKKIFFRAKLDDNPLLLKNSPNYIKQLENLPTMMRDAWLMGNFDIKSGLAFDFLTQERNGFKDEMFKATKYPWYIAMDWGFLDPVAIGFYCVFEDELIIKFDELKLVAKTPLEVANILKEKIRILGGEANIMGMVADPSIFNHTQGLSIAEQFANEGIYFSRANNQREAGFMRMYHLLKEQKFLIDVKCEYFWRSVPELLLDENRDGDIVQGGDDHSYDETRYGLMGILL
jgi:phage terminase large subunit